MPSTVGRRLIQKNMKKAAEAKEKNRDNDDFEDEFNHATTEEDEGNYAYTGHLDDTGDNKDEQPTGRSIFGRGGRRYIKKGSSFGDSGFTKSDTTLKALSDPKSELSRFLLTEREEDMKWKSLRSIEDRANGAVFGKESSMVKGMRSNLAWLYSMSLEPMDVRKERIIMLSEAYAIFGALFLSGTWVLYEWGSSLGYGGCSVGDSFVCHPGLDRAFEAIMTMAITANLFLAMFASFVWLMSVMFSGTHQNWVFGCRHILVFCHTLLCCVLVLTMGGVGVGIFTKLAPNWPELVIAMAFFVIIAVSGMYQCSDLMARQLPLEYYHSPLWFKWVIVPFPMLTKKSRDNIKAGAHRRAKELKTRAFKERAVMDPSPKLKECYTAIGKLLRVSANNIGKKDHDISQYEARLEKDWYTNTEELRSMNIDVLARYMPRRLADEVHKNLALESLNETGGLRSFSIGRGMVGDDGEKRVSWRMDSETSSIEAYDE